MKIIIINDNGEREIIRCRKIEPSNLSKGTLIIDEGDYVISTDDVMAIID